MENTELEQLMGQLMLQPRDTIEQLIDGLTPAIYHNLKSAIELSKWPDGTRLSSEQLDYCMQAVILYEARHVPATERTGYDLPTGCARSPRRPADESSANHTGMTDTVMTDSSMTDTLTLKHKGPQ